MSHTRREVNGEGSVFFTTTRCFEFLVPEYTMYVCEGGKRERIDSNCVRVCVCVCVCIRTHDHLLTGGGGMVCMCMCVCCWLLADDNFS